MKRYLLIFALAFAVFVPSATTVVAQDAVPDDKKANMMFDFDVKSFRESKIVEAYGFEKLAYDFDMEEDYTGINPSHVNRLLAVFRFPDDVDKVVEMRPGGEFPIEFLWLLEVTETPQQLKEEWENQFDKVEKDGKTYLTPNDVPGLYIGFEEGRAFACTEVFLSMDIDKIMTDDLKATVAKLPEEQMAKAAVDIDSARKFLDGLYELDDDQIWSVLPAPEILPLIKPYRHIDAIALSLDINKQILASGFSQSADEESAKSFESDFSQMLGMARIGGMMLMGEAGIENEGDKATFNSVLKQLKTTREGVVNRMEIRQPEGFDSLVATMTEELKTRAAAANKMNRFRQAALAIHNFHDAYRSLPFGELKVGEFDPDLSWRARVAPFMEIASPFDNAQAWDSEQNKPFAEQMPSSFGADKKNTDIVWIESKVKRFENIADGSSNTIMLLEYPDGVPWTQPKDISVLQAIQLIKNLEDGEKLVAVFYDASTHMIDNTLTHNQIKALLSPNGGEDVNAWELLNR
jgi:hypothetical protein